MMFQLMQNLTLLVFAGFLIVDVDGFLFWGRRRREKIVQNIHHHNTNNCNCNIIMNALIARIEKLEKKLHGKRELAAIFDLDENYPGVDLVFQHLDTKRDGMVDSSDLGAVVKRFQQLQCHRRRSESTCWWAARKVLPANRKASQSSSSNNLNYCHCGRSLIDQISMDLM